MVVNTNLNQDQETEVPPGNDPNDDALQLLKKNIELSEEILKLTKKISNSIKWSRIFSLFKLLLIVIPLVLGYLYLQPLLNDLRSFYSDLLGIKQEATNLGVGEIDLDQLPPDILNQVKRYLK